MIVGTLLVSFGLFRLVLHLPYEGEFCHDVATAFFLFLDIEGSGFSAERNILHTNLKGVVGADRRLTYRNGRDHIVAVGNFQLHGNLTFLEQIHNVIGRIIR